MFKITWLDANPVAMGEVFNDIRELKRKYNAHSHVLYPIDVNENNEIMLLKNDDKPKGYIVVSKRQYRTDNKRLLYSKIEDVIKHINVDIEDFLKELNNR